jgi:hypothetical protein
VDGQIPREQSTRSRYRTIQDVRFFRFDGMSALRKRMSHSVRFGPRLAAIATSFCSNWDGFRIAIAFSTELRLADQRSRKEMASVWSIQERSAISLYPRISRIASAVKRKLIWNRRVGSRLAEGAATMSGRP